MAIIQKHKKRNIFFTLFIIALVVCVSGFLVNWTNSYYKTVNSSTATDYEQFNLTAIPAQTVFFGDSITEFYNTDDFYDDFIRESGQMVYNRGISGNNTYDLLARLTQNVLNIHPKNLVLLIGTNDLVKGYSVERISENVRTILKECKAEQVENIILTAVYPVNPFKNVFGLFMVNIRTNNKINQLNQALHTVADEEGVTFLDYTDELKDAQGRLRKEYTLDGLHINREGYVVATNHIKPLLIA